LPCFHFVPFSFIIDWLVGVLITCYLFFDLIPMLRLAYSLTSLMAAQPLLQQGRATQLCEPPLILQINLSVLSCLCSVLPPSPPTGSPFSILSQPHQAEVVYILHSQQNIEFCWSVSKKVKEREKTGWGVEFSCSFPMKQTSAVSVTAHSGTCAIPSPCRDFPDCCVQLKDVHFLIYHYCFFIFILFIIILLLY
jgi:hypothetical protein